MVTVRATSAPPTRAQLLWPRNVQCVGAKPAARSPLSRLSDKRSAADSRLKLRASPGKGGHKVIGVEDVLAHEQHDLSKLTVVQLKTLLRGRGLKVSGNKAELIERLKMKGGQGGGDDGKDPSAGGHKGQAPSSSSPASKDPLALENVAQLMLKAGVSVPKSYVGAARLCQDDQRVGPPEGQEKGNIEEESEAELDSVRKVEAKNQSARAQQRSVPWESERRPAKTQQSAGGNRGAGNVRSLQESGSRRGAGVGGGSGAESRARLMARSRVEARAAGMGKEVKGRAVTERSDGPGQGAASHQHREAASSQPRSDDVPEQSGKLGRREVCATVERAPRESGDRVCGGSPGKGRERSGGLPHIPGVIFVEGANDVKAVKKAVTAGRVVAVTQVMNRMQKKFFSREMKKLAGEHDSVFLLLDPDIAGAQYRADLNQLLPQALNAFIPVPLCSATEDTTWHEAGSVGVENAEPETIRAALKRARAAKEGRKEFTMEELKEWGLIGRLGETQKESRKWVPLGGIATRRRLFAEALGLHDAAGKTILSYMNKYFKREEVMAALDGLPKEGDPIPEKMTDRDDDPHRRNGRDSAAPVGFLSYPVW